MKKYLTLPFLSAVALFFAVAAPTAIAQAPTTYRVDTLQGLLNITLFGSDAKVNAWVGGETAEDDGLGGVFWYDGTATTATNVYAVFKPKNNNGRWFKLPTSVAWQNSAVTVATDTTYAWKLLRGTAQTNFFGIGADNNIAYLQTFNGKNLHINNQGNNVILHGTGVGSTIVGNTLVVTNATTLQSTLAVGGGAVIRAIYSATDTLNFPAIDSGTVTNLTVTVTGAGTNSTVTATPAGGSFTEGAALLAFVSATNTVTVRALNTTAGSVDPATAAFRITVIQY